MLIWVMQLLLKHDWHCLSLKKYHDTINLTTKGFGYQMNDYGSLRGVWMIMVSCEELCLLVGSTLYVPWVCVEKKQCNYSCQPNRTPNWEECLIRKQIRCKQMDIFIHYAANSGKGSTEYFWIKCKILNKDHEFFWALHSILQIY